VLELSTLLPLSHGYRMGAFRAVTLFTLFGEE